MFQSPRERGSEVSRKVFTVGCQDIEFEVQEGRGEGEEFSAAARLANTVLLCYRASDLMSLHEAVTKVRLQLQYLFIVFTITEITNLPNSGCPW